MTSLPTNSTYNLRRNNKTATTTNKNGDGNGNSDDVTNTADEIDNRFQELEARLDSKLDAVLALLQPQGQRLSSSPTPAEGGPAAAAPSSTSPTTRKKQPTSPNVYSSLNNDNGDDDDDEPRRQKPLDNEDDDDVEVTFTTTARRQTLNKYVSNALKNHNEWRPGTRGENRTLADVEFFLTGVIASQAGPAWQQHKDYLLFYGLTLFCQGEAARPIQAYLATNAEKQMTMYRSGPLLAMLRQRFPDTRKPVVIDFHETISGGPITAASHLKDAANLNRLFDRNDLPPDLGPTNPCWPTTWIARLHHTVRDQVLRRTATDASEATIHDLITATVNYYRTHPTSSAASNRNGNQRSSSASNDPQQATLDGLTTQQGGKPPLCRDFAVRGQCPRGPNCRYRHEATSSANTSATSATAAPSAAGKPPFNSGSHGPTTPAATATSATTERKN